MPILTIPAETGFPEQASLPGNLILIPLLKIPKLVHKMFLCRKLLAADKAIIRCHTGNLWLLHKKRLVTPEAAISLSSLYKPASQVAILICKLLAPSPNGERVPKAIGGWVNGRACWQSEEASETDTEKMEIESEIPIGKMKNRIGKT